MSEACQHWIDLSDRFIRGESVSGEQQVFLRMHQAACPACAREAAAWRQLRPPMLHSVPSSAEVDEILRHASSIGNAPLQLRSVVGEGWPRRIAAALACAAAVLLVLGGARTLGPRRAEVARMVAPAPSRGVPVQASLHAKNEVSTTTNAEDTCGELVAGIALCLAAGSEIARVELEPPHRVVHLKRGRALASLQPQPAGTSFSIATDSGRVTAVGTIFSVEVAGDGAAIARVTRGKVAVYASASSHGQALLAGQMLRLGQPRAVHLPEQDRLRDLSLMARLSPPTPEPSLATPKASPGPAKDELAHARALLARRDFSGAAAAYRSIYAQDPHGSAGRAALVSLGTLLLSSLNDAEGALHAFNTYLVGRGPLTQQAEYGCIRALRALGRSKEERAAIDAFIRRYPAAPETRTLRRAEGQTRGRP